MSPAKSAGPLLQRHSLKERPHRERRPPVKLRELAEQMEGKQVFAVGQMVEVLWNEKDLEGTNWEPGWYKGEIERFDEENDIVFIWYYKRPCGVQS